MMMDQDRTRRSSTFQKLLLLSAEKGLLSYPGLSIPSLLPTKEEKALFLTWFSSYNFRQENVCLTQNYIARYVHRWIPALMANWVCMLFFSLLSAKERLDVGCVNEYWRWSRRLEKCKIRESLVIYWVRAPRPYQATYFTLMVVIRLGIFEERGN